MEIGAVFGDLTLIEYETDAAEFARYEGKLPGVVYVALGLAGEAGEVANKVKKIYRDDGGEITVERRSEIIDELGDVLWYAAMLAKELGVSLENVALRNLAKLEQRKNTSGEDPHPPAPSPAPRGEGE